MVTLLFLMLLSCGGENTAPIEPVNTKPKQTDSVVTDTCAQKLSADDFDNFLGITYGMNELLLESKLGPYTGGEYTSDSLSFVYYFKKIEGVPISVWVDAKSQKVITIFMEILGYEELFQADLDEAIKEYSMSECESRFFGMTFEELKAVMGEPAKDEVIKDGIRSVDYDSKDYKYSVNFKFHPAQNNLCSAISVNWFY